MLRGFPILNIVQRNKIIKLYYMLKVIKLLYSVMRIKNQAKDFSGKIFIHEKVIHLMCNPGFEPTLSMGAHFFFNFN